MGYLRRQWVSVPSPLSEGGGERGKANRLHPINSSIKQRTTSGNGHQGPSAPRLGGKQLGGVAEQAGLGPPPTGRAGSLAGPRCEHAGMLECRRAQAFTNGTGLTRCRLSVK